MERWMHDTSSVGDKTAHLLCHTFTEATEDRIHGIIKGYIEDNPKKIQELAGPWLKWKKTTVSDYVNFIVEKGSKFDEQGEDNRIEEEKTKEIWVLHMQRCC